ncbi:unnamed protein product, partial [Rotaria sp. Silwood1]
MPHLYCPCGALLTGGSTIRSLKPPCLRLFISIRTMKYVSPEEKVCNACRTAYYNWKSNNPEFGCIFSRIEQELSDAEEVMNMNSNDEMDTHADITDCQTSPSDHNSNAIIKDETITLPMNCTVSSHKICCVCRLTIEGGSYVVTSEDRDLVLLKKNVFIPEGARYCSNHLVNGQLSMVAIDMISPSTIQYKKLSSNDVQLLINRLQIIFEKQKRLDFDNMESLSDDECKTFTSLSKVQFNELISFTSTFDIRNSTSRSIRNAIAILLCKLRLGLSNKLLAVLFQIPDKRAISRTLSSARAALMNKFVPENLGFNHVARREIIDRHTSTISQQLMCNDESDKAIIVADSTYIYIQDNVVVLDRGFRDSVEIMEELGLNVALPSFLNGRHQFTTDEANQSRYVTKIRWMVEAVNSRIKQFKFLSNTVQNSSLPYLEQYLSIACALINRYQSPLKTNTSEDAEIGQKMIALRNQKKKFETFLDKNNLKKQSSKWERLNHTDIMDEFPVLCENDIVNNISLGIFQLKRARSYAEERAATTNLTGPVNYPIYRCKDFPDIIRAPTRSAHKNRITYNPTIKFTSNEILDWWCDCTIGNGSIGCCSHIASFIWFLSYERWQDNNRYMPSGDFIDYVVDSSQISDFYDSTDDEDK